MSAPDDLSASPPRKRRWYQFSLRTLMIVMLLASIGMSWFAVKMQQLRRQRLLIKAVEQAGGWTMYDYEWRAWCAEPPGPKWLQGLLGEDFLAHVAYVQAGPDTDDALLERICEMPYLARLELSGTKITDAGLGHLQRLSHLIELSMSGTRVSDEGLACLSGLTQLRELQIDGTQVTDEGLSHLKGLKDLEMLDLCATRVTDAGLRHLKEMGRFGKLDLSRTAITDAGLLDLPEFHAIDLHGTKVSEEGVQKLRETLTGRAYVYWEPDWPSAVAADQPSVKVEFRVAETKPADGLSEATVVSSDQKIYLHKAAEITNADIVRATPMQSHRQPGCEIVVRFNKEGASKMAQLSEAHRDKLLAILIDGKVVFTAAIRDTITEDAIISGLSTREEAERLSKGITGH